MDLLSKWLESLDYEYEILPSCTRHVSPLSTCHKCANACTEQAISMVNGKPEFDRKKCIECGYCISACPVQAVAGIFPNRTILQNQLVINEKNIPTVKELLILYKKGIKTIVGETQALVVSWQQPVEEANVILRKVKEEPFSLVTKSVAEETYVTRRELFFLWKNEGKSVMRGIAPAKWRFNQQDINLSKYFPDVQFANIAINVEKCTLCNICQKLCKKKCLDVREEHFLINPRGCENCQLCVDACPEKAIFVEDHISRVEETWLPIYEKHCSHCHNTFTTLREDEEKCVICTKREIILKKMERA